MIKSPILTLPEGTTVISMYADDVTGTILVSLSDGRILRMDEVSMLAGLTGDRILSAQVMDGLGNLSAVGGTSILYALHNRVIEINRMKNQIKWKEVVAPFSATSMEEVVGVFTSPVMWAGDDWGFWKGLYWEYNATEGTRVTMQARVSADRTSILSSPWYDMSPGSVEGDPVATESSSSSGSGTVDEFKRFKSLDCFNSKGSYIQVRMILGSINPLTRPMVSRVTVSYETKFAVYFFTQKFIMSSGSNVNNMFLTGSWSAPQNTEIKFGVSPVGSADWNDYTVIDPGVVAKTPPGVSDRLKMGIKMLSWDDTAIPFVDEFAVMIGAEKDNLLNGGG